MFKKSAIVPPGSLAIDLLAYESSRAFAVTPGITTITFFHADGTDRVFKNIRARFYKVLKVNPWLAGRLRRFKDKERLQLLYPKSIDDSHLDALIHMRGSLSVTQSSPHKEVFFAITKNKTAQIPSGFSLINSERPLVSLTLSPTANNEFSLVFSISHIIADGATYYAILNNLLSDEAAIALNPVRSADYSWEKAIGHEDHSLLFNKFYLFNLMRGALFGPKVSISSFNLDNNKIAEIKREYQAEHSIPPYISTNDIITSRFMNAINPRLCMMSINFRNRLPEVTSSDAGNYEGVKFYDPGVFSQPQGIRQSLATPVPYTTRVAPLPKGCELFSMRAGLITNWATFSAVFSVKGSRQILHCPIIDARMIPYDTAIVFNPLPNRTAILLMSKYTSYHDDTKPEIRAFRELLADPIL